MQKYQSWLPVDLEPGVNKVLFIPSQNRMVEVFRVTPTRLLVDGEQLDIPAHAAGFLMLHIACSSQPKEPQA